MKSVLNILDYFLEQFQRFSRGLQPKMFSTDFIFRPEMSGWIQATMQQNTISKTSLDDDMS